MSNDRLSLVCFKIGDELYGINIMEVREIVQLTEITPIPNSPKFVDGVINLRGEIIPIADLRKRFNFLPKTFTEDEELLRGILIFNVDSLVIGIIIDQIYRVVTVAETQIQPPPQMITGIAQEFVKGVVRIEDDDNLLILLNVKKLFSKQELMQLAGHA